VQRAIAREHRALGEVERRDQEPIALVKHANQARPIVVSPVLPGETKVQWPTDDRTNYSPNLCARPHDLVAKWRLR